MAYQLNEEQMMIQAMVRDFAREVLMPSASERDRTGEFPRENLEGFKQLLGSRYEVKTDGELADLVARKGDALLTEILAAQKGETRND